MTNLLTPGEYDIQSYLDGDDFRVEIGTIMQFTEFFATPDTECKYYVVRRLPNLGNTVILCECLIDDTGAVAELRESCIEVEPWKIGAI